MKKKMLYSFLTSFVSLLIFSVFLSVAYFEADWYSHLLSARIFSFPFLFYIFIFSGMSSLIYTARTFYIKKEELGEIEEYMRYLAKGEYSEALFNALKDPDRTNPISNLEITRLIIEVRNLLFELSKEAQGTFKDEEHQMFQSKEDILEEERHRIARELHDSVSQQLFAATMMLSAVNEQSNQLPEQYQKQLHLTQKILNESQTEMRALLLHLRPVKLEGKSLKEGIEQLLKELKTKTEIKILWNVHDVFLDPAIEDHLFRIIQELLSNTLRHAKADLLEVYLTEIDQNVLLKVVDDGVGFDTSKANIGSYGLKNIKERIFGMGGSVKILSFKNKGTSIEIKVPIV